MPVNVNLNELAGLRAEVRRLRAALCRQSPGIEVLLKRRGFRIYKHEPPDDLLVPQRRYVTAFYGSLHKYSFRLLLRDIIKHQQSFTLADVARYATPRVTEVYLDFLRSIGLIRMRAGRYSLAKGPIRNFGTTLEWYVAEILRREFKAESVWGVKFKRPLVGGDYDVIAALDSTLVYLEVKSSPPKQIYDSEIAAFLDRVADLAPAISIFLVDTELRMKDKLVPMFENELKKRYRTPPKVIRVERELFQIRNRIFIMNAKESIVRNIEKAVSRYYQGTVGLPR